MRMLTPFPRLHLRSRVLIFVTAFVLIWTILPYDNAFVLLVRWHSNSALTILTANDGWLSESVNFPLDLDDIGIVIKTGFSTRERLLARLDAFEDAHIQGNVVIVGDYATVLGAHFNHSGLEIPVHNVLAWVVESGALSSRPRSPRLQYYSNLTAALASGDTDFARTIGETYGWELDIMKHISGLELGYKLMPHKKWYILLDDDTYVLDASLRLILGHLDPSVPHYIGNAVGDYKARFAHGGSAVVLSRAAMNRIFIQNSEVVTKAHLESLDARLGDKLIATTAMKSGIYLEERYNRHFNGEAPSITRIRGDRFCLPIVSFHKMSPTQMRDVGRTFKGTVDALLWIDLWDVYRAPTFGAFRVDPIRSDWDHVGRVDEATMTTKDVKTKEDCLQICHVHSSTCLAWTWETEREVCHISPWMIVGHPANGKFSGVNAPRAMKLLGKCH